MVHGRGSQYLFGDVGTPDVGELNLPPVGSCDADGAQDALERLCSSHIRVCAHEDAQVADGLLRGGI
jgi:hypothetical protein